MPASKDARTELLQVAQGILLTAINARGAVPSGDEIRQCVREAREFIAEVDTPTKRKQTRAKRATRDDDELGPSAELMYDGEQW